MDGPALGDLQLLRDEEGDKRCGHHEYGEIHGVSEVGADFIARPAHSQAHENAYRERIEEHAGGGPKTEMVPVSYLEGERKNHQGGAVINKRFGLQDGDGRLG